MTAALAERRGGRDDEYEVAEPCCDGRRGVAEQRHRAGAAVAAGKRDSRRDAENRRHFFGPERLRMSGCINRGQALAVEVFFC
jgi:hypothetical protein